MSTSLLDHAFSIRGYEYVRTDYRGGKVVFTIYQDPMTSGVKRATRERPNHEAKPRGNFDRSPSAAGPPP